jgi:hypothetical protein
MKEPARLNSLNLLYPPITAVLLLGVESANKAGYPIAIFETFRTPARQNQVYAQGRTSPGRIVTNAKAYRSWHQYGIAADVALFDDGRWSWDFDPKKISQFFDLDKLIWGGTFRRPDGPHYEWRNKPSLVVSEALVKSQGILRFWAELDALAS